ncbi:aminotransferase class I/II-fold pyridoxal phosphate-dependent enzyme, partial [Escherichia coli]|uniref:aminotransferase class I/II-fold pyridoxal phosphate-dependent enzyme n=1 Tax=Escherichia coli TaxID=562 RepID=UPI00128FAA7C
RYLREAKAELEAARKMPYMAPSFVLEAVRKARNAIYYSLGEPAFIENVVKEAVEKMQFRNDPVLRCLVEIEGMKEKTIILDGFSKTYAMTGWRLGYGVMRKDLAEKITQLMINSNSCTCAFVQMAGVEALKG